MNKEVIIGAWHITPDQNKLSLNEKDFFVEPLAMDVLVYFAKNPEKVIGLEELVEAVWKGRVVGDHAIYRIINQIRKILGEDKGVSYIITIRKKGYQLKQPVSLPLVELDTAKMPIENEGVEASSGGQVKKEPNAKLRYAYGLPVLFVFAYFVGQWAFKFLAYRAIKPFDVVKPFSVLIGEEKDPSFSRDGHFISYSHQAKSEQYSKLFVQSTAGESPFQLTTGPGDDFSPSWSPDGKELVFVRHLDGRCQIMKIAAKEPVTEPESVIKCSASGLSNEVIWGSGDTIYFNDSLSEVDPYKIYKYSLMTSKKEQLTNPATGKSKGDIHIALSNNQTQLAFSRDLDWGSTQVKLLDLATHQVSDLFNLGGWRKALTWSLDDQQLYYIDEDDNINAYSIKHGFSKLVFSNAETLHSIASQKDQDRLAIMTGETGINIWRNYLDAQSTKQLESPFIESSEIDLFPEFAHNSNDIAFMSLRSGQPQIWVKPESGREYQLSKFLDGRGVQRIRWAPDDRNVLGSFDNELYIIDVSTKNYSTLWEAQGSHRVEGATWSLDGRFVYFSSDMDGDWQIYKKSVNSSSAPVRVTDRGGYSPEFLADGSMLYYKYHQNGLWRMAVSTKEETKLVDDTNVFAYDALYARNQGFFYLAVGDKQNTLRFYDLETDEVTDVQVLNNPLLDYTISGDASVILYPKILNDETEIKLLEKS